MAASKPSKTSKDEQTAPVLTNSLIYRAGKNPLKRANDSDQDDIEMVQNSYVLPDQLSSRQQPTFVDALKRRRDHSGRIITKSLLVGPTKRGKPIASTSSISPSAICPINSTPTAPVIPQHTSTLHAPSRSLSHSLSASSSPQIPRPTTSTVQFNNIPSPCTIPSEYGALSNTQQPVPSQVENQHESESETDSDSSEDFQMDSLTVPVVENTNGITTNEADDIREKLKLKQLKLKEQESAPVIVKPAEIRHDPQSDDESGSSEYETATSSESDNEDIRNRRKRKIVFLNKEQREAHLQNASKPSLEEEAELLDALEEERVHKMRMETSEKVLDHIREQEKLEENGNDHSDDELPDDNDEDPDGTEYEAWKVREMKRIMRDETEREEREQEVAEIERRREMTDEQIMKENEREGLHQKSSKKGQMKFMQKYYHQGVFYRDGSIVDEQMLERNFNAPTGQDKYIDFSKVPKAMLTKNFGKMSQSKWTHLANEDTTYSKEERELFKKRREMTEDEKRKDQTSYKYRHRAHQDNFWFKRGGDGSFERPSYKKGTMKSGNERFERKEDRWERERDERRDKERKERRRRDKEQRSDRRYRDKDRDGQRRRRRRDRSYS